MSFELNNVFLIRLQIYSRTLPCSPPPQWQTSSPCRSHSATIIFAKCGAELFPTHDLNDCVMMTVESVLNLLNDDYLSPLSLSVLPFTKLSATYQMCWHGYFFLAVSSSSFPVPTESYKAFPHTSCGAGSLIMIPWKSENTFRWCDRLLLFFLFKMSSFFPTANNNNKEFDSGNAVILVCYLLGLYVRLSI